MTATPRLAITELVSGQAVPESAVNEGLLILEFFANGCHFKSRANNPAEPGSPAEGDCYLLTGTPTGTHWSGQGGKIALFYNGAWTFKAAKEGFTAWVDDEDIIIVYNGAAWNAPPTSSSGFVRPVAFFFTTTPTASEVLCLYVAADAFTLAANLAGSQVVVGTNPTATFALDLQKNGSTIGTISISTGGVATLTTSGGTSKAIVAGDVLKVVAPGTPDATAANIAVTLKGTL